MSTACEIGMRQEAAKKAIDELATGLRARLLKVLIEHMIIYSIYRKYYRHMWE